MSRTLWAGLSLAAVCGTSSAFLVDRTADTWLALLLRHEPLDVLAYAIALSFCMKILADCRVHSTMRIAWILMAASMAVAIVRHGYEWTLIVTGLNRTPLLTTVVSLRQIPIVLSLLLLT